MKKNEKTEKALPTNRQKKVTLLRALKKTKTFFSVKAKTLWERKKNMKKSKKKTSKG